MTGTDSNGVPLTRRQIREQAAAAAEAAGAGGPGSARLDTAPAAPEQGRSQQAAPPAQRPRTATPPAQARQPAAQQPVPRSEPSRAAQPSRSAQPTRQPQQAQTPQPSRVGHGRGPQPSRPAAGEQSAGGANVSRRALREQTGVQRPVVVPPIQSNAIRTVDETGELTGLRDLGTGRSPHAAPSTRPAVEPAASQPPVQRQPVQRVPAQRQPSQRQRSEPERAQPAPVPAGPVQPPAAQPPLVRRQSLQGLPTRQPGETGPLRDQGPAPLPGMLGPDTGRRPWPPVEPIPGAATGAPAAFRTPQVSRPAGDATGRQDTDTFHQRISVPADEPARDAVPEEDAFVEELPKWDAITSAPSTSRSTPPVVARDIAALEDDEDDDDDDDDEDDDENEHQYTWLHYLILVALAFVLGLIIWKVGLEDRGTAAPADSSSDASITWQSERTPDLYL